MTRPCARPPPRSPSVLGRCIGPAQANPTPASESRSLDSARSCRTGTRSLPPAECHKHARLKPITPVKTHLQLIHKQRLVKMPLQKRYLLSTAIRHSERPHQSLLVKCGHGLGDVIGVSQWVGSVQQQHIDDVSAQPRQALLDPPNDALASQVIETRPLALSEPDAALGLKDDAPTQLRGASTGPRRTRPRPCRDDKCRRGQRS